MKYQVEILKQGLLLTASVFTALSSMAASADEWKYKENIYSVEATEWYTATGRILAEAAEYYEKINNPGEKFQLSGQVIEINFSGHFEDHERQMILPATASLRVKKDKTTTISNTIAFSGAGVGLLNILQLHLLAPTASEYALLLAWYAPVLIPLTAVAIAMKHGPVFTEESIKLSPQTAADLYLQYTSALL